MERALVEISGGLWDGTVFEIDLDPNTGEPPPTFDVSDDGQYLLDLTRSRILGRRYGAEPTQPIFEPRPEDSLTPTIYCPRKGA
jgi:hypothetical protein